VISDHGQVKIAASRAVRSLMAQHDSARAPAPGSEEPVLPLPRAKHLPLRPPAGAPPELVPARMVNEVLYCERLLFLEWAQREWADNFYTVDGKHTHRRADVAGGELPPVPPVPVPPEALRNMASPHAAGGDDAESAAPNADATPEADGGQTGAKPRVRGRKRDRSDDDTGDLTPPYQARSVWLSSDALGLTAKIDIVEGDEGGRVVPIEYKRGKAPDLPGGAYLPEQAQICAHVLLLREHGYTCDEGAIYFAGSRRRVAIAIDDGLVAITRWAIRRAREVARFEEPPPPLVDSPKCNGCSLIGICLPDEVNLLKLLRGEAPDDGPEEPDLDGPLDPDPWGLAAPPPPDPARIEEQTVAGPAKGLRRLHPSRDDRVPVYVQDHTGHVGLAGGRLAIRGKDGTTHARLMNTSQVVLLGNAQISTQALRSLLERGIPVSFHTGGGWLVGRATGADSNNVDLRLAQYRAASDAQVCIALARQLVATKVKNCRTLLRRNHAAPDAVVLGQLKQLARKAVEAESLESLLGIEGSAARVYFQAFTGMLKADDLGTFDFDGRNRRPPRDPVNALLSFLYAMLTKDFAQTVAAVGLDPLLGFFHQPRFGRPALALDLMEEFRPLVADSAVVAAINTRVVDRDDFAHVAGACNLTQSGRRKVIDVYERRMDQLIEHPVFGYRISYRRVIEVQARLLGRVLMGEIESYPSFRTR
jgi:CRISPR-associated protein Cas1